MISVAMAAFNGRQFIEEQITSILMQLKASDELVIADNGSSDGTWEWLQKLAITDSRVVIFLNLDTQGVLANFEYALQHCRGEIIFLSDQDDYWFPNKVQVMTQAFEASSCLLLVQSDAQLIDEDNHVTAASFYKLRHSGPGLLKNFIRNTYQGCTLAFRRELLDLALPFPPHVPMHDMWLGLLAESIGDVQFIPECLTAYRRHSQNRSGLHPRETQQVIRWRFDLASALLGRSRQIRRARKQGRKTV